ncbi:unnamed protein product [Clonostachys byssicola]|uniref:Autophagy-related protein 1 n=1 Tax=Clonostachys byssicola TaxID=160290 RepID=A0A9N9Y1J0_9HYPO|nr:unnamed protein product [Clonostachys byssicola]
MAYLNSLPDLPEIVRDSRLNATFHTDGRQSYIVHKRGGAHRRAKETQDVWVHEKHLGSGGYGRVDVQVKESKHPGPRQLRAVKTILISDKELRSRRDFYVRELEAIIKFSQVRYDDLFVKTYGWYASDNHLFIAMEYCELGDLHKYLKTRPDRRLPEDQTREIASQVLDALCRMHEENFAHGDLKPHNILIKHRPPDPWVVKLSDFGISRRSRNEDTAPSPITTVRGTDGFMPPEMLNISGSSSTSINLYAADMWCVGESIFRILTGRPTFENTQDLYGYYFKVGQFPAQVLRDAQVSEQAIAFLSSLVVCNPSERLTAKQALSYPWIMMAIPESPVFKFSDSLAVSRSYTNLFRHTLASRMQLAFEEEASGTWDTQTQPIDVLEDDEGLELQIPSAKLNVGVPGQQLDINQPIHKPTLSLAEPASGSWSTGTLHKKSQSLDPTDTGPATGLQRGGFLKRPNGAAPRRNRRTSKDEPKAPVDQGAFAQQETRLQLEANEHLKKGQYEDAAWLLQELSILKSKLPGIERQPSQEQIEQEKLDVVAQNLRLAETEGEKCRAMGYLAITLFKMDMFVSAEFCYLDFIKREKESLSGPTVQFNPCLVERENLIRLDSFLIDLAHTLVRQEKIEDAKHVYEEVISHKIELYGTAHQETIDVMYELAEVLRSRDKFEDAKRIYQDAVRARRTKLGETNPLTLESNTRLQKLEEMVGSRTDPSTQQHLQQSTPKFLARKPIPDLRPEDVEDRKAEKNEELDHVPLPDKERGSKEEEHSLSLETAQRSRGQKASPPRETAGFSGVSKGHKSTAKWKKYCLCGLA